ncbi:hypothetical protein [Pseudocolwellia agarivorans]|uniref:hypothetical protein n=1 Tax=Pseudocolwellia agarivorans TaxID=1911682 RepID=UPI0011154FB4|nr:hypothetical protein [Pseudocolwellia agarivorans]
MTWLTICLQQLFNTGTKMMQKILWISLPIVLSACSSQQLYQHTQNQVEINCNHKVGVEREQCLDKINTKPYKEYEAERQEIINGK